LALLGYGWRKIIKVGPLYHPAAKAVKEFSSFGQNQVAVSMVLPLRKLWQAGYSGWTFGMAPALPTAYCRAVRMLLAVEFAENFNEREVPLVWREASSIERGRREWQSPP
jgi:hypothetical protein